MKTERAFALSVFFLVRDSNEFRAAHRYADEKWFYVNSWGRDKTQIIASRVGVESPARFLCTAEENSVSEITEVTYPEADPLQDFGLVVAALNKAI